MISNLPKNEVQGNEYKDTHQTQENKHSEKFQELKLIERTKQS